MNVSKILLLTLSLLPQIIITEVNPISPGENLWIILNRINDAETSILETISNVGCDSQCSFTIGQGNVPYTISQSGTYCLIEDITLTATMTPGIHVIDTGSGLTENVIIEMNDYTITGTTGVTGILLDAPNFSGSAQVTIRNGSIVNCQEAIIATQVAGLQLYDITIIGGPAGSIGMDVNTINNMLVRNVSVQLFGQGFVASGGVNGLVMDNCTFTNFTTAGVVFGDSAINNLIMRTTVNGGPVGFTLNCSPGTFVLLNCVATNCTTTGFDLGSSAFNRVILSGCQAASDGNGIVLRADVQLTSKAALECFASNNTATAIDILGHHAVLGCTALNNTAAGIVADPSLNSYTDILVQNNESRSNGLNYSNVYISTIDFVNTTTATGFWANISS